VTAHECQFDLRRGPHCRLCGQTKYEQIRAKVKATWPNTEAGKAAEELRGCGLVVVHVAGKGHSLQIEGIEVPIAPGIEAAAIVAGVLPAFGRGDA
jgi:hypothetical protein